MDLNTYNEIIKARGNITGEDPFKADQKTQGKYLYGECQFRNDLLLRKANWTDNKCYDFWLWLRCHHVFLSALCTPKHHPYRQDQRWATIFCLFAMCTMFTAIAANYDSKLKNLKETTLEAFGFRFGASLANAVVLAIVEVLLALFFTCPCAELSLQPQGKTVCYRCCFYCGRRGILLVFLFALSCFTFGVVYALFWRISFYTFVFIFVSSFAGSWSLKVIAEYCKFKKEFAREREQYEPDAYLGGGAGVDLSGDDRVEFENMILDVRGTREKKKKKKRGREGGKEKKLAVSYLDYKKYKEWKESGTRGNEEWKVMLGKKERKLCLGSQGKQKNAVVKSGKREYECI